MIQRLILQYAAVLKYATVLQNTVLTESSETPHQKGLVMLDIYTHIHRYIHTYINDYNNIQLHIVNIYILPHRVATVFVNYD